MTLGKDRIVAALGCVLLLLASWPAIAQVVLPGTADPLRLQEQRRPTPSPRPSGPAMQLEEEAPPAPPAGAEDIRFTLTRLVVEGATAYPIAGAAAGMAGPDRPRDQPARPLRRRDEDHAAIPQ